uniref:RNA-directed DNA polymerase n=1 Tax=Globodera rostochiensis TaxID=31243 RepID=A0A914HGS8_GLORO
MGELDWNENVYPLTSEKRIIDINGQEVKCHGVVQLPITRGAQTKQTRLFVAQTSFGYDLLFGTNALSQLGFKLIDGINMQVVEFSEADDQNKNSVHVIYKTTLLPNASTLIELSVPPEMEGKQLLISEGEQSDDQIRVEPTLSTGQNGKIVAPITNLSTLPITLEENTEIAHAELVGNDDRKRASPRGRSSVVAKAETEGNRAEKIHKIWTERAGRLKEEEEHELEALIGEFESIFALEDTELTQTDLARHSIDTGNATPIKGRMRPVAFSHREKVSKMILDYLERGLVRPSRSPWASPIVLVPKKDGSIRFCVDYRGVNSVTTKDAYPLPNIDNILLALGGKQYFSTLDFLSGYWQIKMDESSIEKTAFTTEFGLHEFVVLPFGLCNAVATYQRFMSCHVLTREGIKMNADKIRPIVALPIPRTKKELHSFLGFMTYYRKFIYGFGAMAAPLFRLLKKNTPFKMEEEEVKVVNKLKQKVLEDVLLYFPDFSAATNDNSRRFIIITDASKIGISAVLCQTDQEKRIRPIYFASRQCNKHENRYCPTELEALAVRFGVWKFAQFITGIPTKIVTDHKALVPMFRSKKETGNARVDRWLMELNARFLLRVEYQPGKTNVVADLLSRSGALAEQGNSHTNYLCDQKSGKTQLFVPKEHREKLIEQRHAGTCSGHYSGKKIFRQLGERYFWPNMFGDCVRACISCRICAHNRKPRANEPPLRTVQTTEPLELVCIDILSIGPAESGNRYILVCIDHFTKYLVATPIPTKSKESIAKAFVRDFILVLGTPKTLHSDQGKEFVNETLSEITSMLGVNKTTTAGYDPQANGITERANQTLLNMLRKSTASHWSWDERLPFITFSYNTTPSEVTKFSPFHLIFGRPAIFPGEQELQIKGNPNYTVDEESYLQLFKENLQHLLESARENSEIARAEAKKHYDLRPNVTANKFSIGDKCMVIYPGASARSPHKKLSWNRFGPYRIVDVGKSSANLVPIDKASAKPITVPIERLVRVPQGVPDISTLPHGKNPYRNILAAPITEKTGKNEPEGAKWGGNQAEKGRKEKRPSNSNQLGTIDLSEAQEEATGRAAPKELQWSEKCEGKEHEFCGRLLCAQLDAVLDVQTEPGNMTVSTPLQALICAFVLRSGAAVSTTVAKDLVKLILGADQGQELVLYEGIRRDNVRAGAFPEERDVERIWALWSEKCTVAKAILQEPGFGAIKISTPEVVQNLPETEKTGWTAIFGQTGWILEKVRATVVHHCPVFIELPRVILGDSSAFQLFSDMRDQTTFVGTERGSLSAVIRALNECVMSSKVQAALVVLGRDSLMNDETVDQIVEQSARIQHLCRRFPSVRIIWLPPPYVREKEGAYNELIGRLAALLGDWFLCVTPTGRSLVELWRYGDSYDRSRVETNGWMTPGGVRAFAAWVKSQIPAWPGNRELGVRSVRSPVDLVRGARLGPGDRPSPSAFQRPGPRFDDRIGSRPHPYRSLPNSARAWHHRDEPVHRWSGRAQR